MKGAEAIVPSGSNAEVIVRSSCLVPWHVMKSSQMEAEAERHAQLRTDLHQKIHSDGKHVVTDDLVQTLRLLALSHRRFTEEQKTKVFRSIVKETRPSITGVELELYVQPTQNALWKYRQKTM